MYLANNSKVNQHEMNEQDVNMDNVGSIIQTLDLYRRQLLKHVAFPAAMKLRAERREGQ